MLEEFLHKFETKFTDKKFKINYDKKLYFNYFYYFSELNLKFENFKLFFKISNLNLKLKNENVLNIGKPYSNLITYRNENSFSSPYFLFYHFLFKQYIKNINVFDKITNDPVTYLQIQNTFFFNFEYFSMKNNKQNFKNNFFFKIKKIKKKTNNSFFKNPYFVFNKIDAFALIFIQYFKKKKTNKLFNNYNVLNKSTSFFFFIKRIEYTITYINFFLILNKFFFKNIHKFNFYFSKQQPNLFIYNFKNQIIKNTQILLKSYYYNYFLNKHDINFITNSFGFIYLSYPFFNENDVSFFSYNIKKKVSLFY
jgi:hypothetical protein